MYVNLSDFCQYTTDDIGVYFSDSTIVGLTNISPLPFNPQINNSAGNIFDSTAWTLVSGNFNAVGNENYLIIGNFKDDSNTNLIYIPGSILFSFTYVYIDDVSLTPCTVIEEQNQKDAIKIYPNPINDKLIIAINNKEFSEIILYDVASRKLLQQHFTNSTSLNTEQLAKGIYIYEVRDKNGVMKKGKVVKGN
jgi:hypothetical protein